jgi:hypothetical protein
MAVSLEVALERAIDKAGIGCMKRKLLGSRALNKRGRDGWPRRKTRGSLAGIGPLYPR